jgi:hypothetical protein
MCIWALAGSERLVQGGEGSGEIAAPNQGTRGFDPLAMPFELGVAVEPPGI